MTSRQLVPALIIPFVAWRVYLRVRRNIGRQPFRPDRLKVSVGIFATIVLIFAATGLMYPPVLAALAGGLALSVPIALGGLKLTKFEDTPQGKFYTPNTALGIGISALFLGRIAYRFLVLYAVTDLQTPQAPQPFQSPLTFFLFGLSAGYFIAYQTGVLIRSHKPAA
ncbi:hypothetical protein [Opitutus sp. GAS368]|jgi:hypothetical protein|uniref:hypothetical protein n=1 Tax=Opitutus sp. GAS368 TaxID=1882749 RepID=UPI00087A1D17|nr:hypothetical protein [Opitutus sp. GAS368]SDR65233.1 hypothetical protein SAMN05444173_0010 [Opitutus sp. GAS368]